MSAELPRRRRANRADRDELSRALATARGAAGRRLALAERARLLLATRRRQHELFGRALLQEPALDLLLNLYLHHPSACSLDALCATVSAYAPASTARRYIAMLQDNGLVRRDGEAPSGQDMDVCLTVAGHMRLTAYLAEPFADRLNGI